MPSMFNNYTRQDGLETLEGTIFDIKSQKEEGIMSLYDKKGQIWFKIDDIVKKI